MFLLERDVFYFDCWNVWTLLFLVLVDHKRLDDLMSLLLNLRDVNSILNKRTKDFLAVLPYRSSVNVKLRQTNLFSSSFEVQTPPLRLYPRESLLIHLFVFSIG